MPRVSAGAFLTDDFIASLLGPTLSAHKDIYLNCGKRRSETNNPAGLLEVCPPFTKVMYVVTIHGKPGLKNIVIPRNLEVTLVSYKYWIHAIEIGTC
jgi:hypothetical protein